MHVIENSHKWDWDDKLKEFCAAGVKDLGDFEQYLANSGRTYRNIPMTLKKGQISVHNGNTFHGSSMNTSEKERMTLTIHLQDHRNVHVPSFKEMASELRLVMNDCAEEMLPAIQITEIHNGFRSCGVRHHMRGKGLMLIETFPEDCAYLLW